MSVLSANDSSIENEIVKEHAVVSSRTPATSAIRPQQTIRSPPRGVGMNRIFSAAAQVPAGAGVVPDAEKFWLMTMRGRELTAFATIEIQFGRRRPARS